MYRGSVVDYTFIDKIREISNVNSKKIQQKSILKINKKINRINEKITRTAEKGQRVVKINTKSFFSFYSITEIEKIMHHFESEGFTVTSDLYYYLQIKW